MDRKARHLVILAAALAVLVVGYVVVTLLVPNGANAPEQETESPAREPVILFSVSENGLTALGVTDTREGTAAARSFVRDTDWHWTEDEAIPLSPAVFTTCARVLYEATGTPIATAVTAAALKNYGLDAPCKEVTFTDTVGGAQSFSLGAYNAYNGTYCATVNGDSATVYMVDASLFEMFDFEVEDAVYVDDLPACKPKDLMSVTFVTGEHTVAVTHEPMETEGAEALGWFRRVDGGEPIRISDTLADRIDLLLGDMDYLDCLSVRAAELVTYGLDRDTTAMTVVYQGTTDGKPTEETFTLTLGAVNEYRYYYVNPVGTPITMLLGGDIWHRLITEDDQSISAETGA